MSHPDDNRAKKTKVILPAKPPELTPAAARGLLALLLELDAETPPPEPRRTPQ